MNGIQKFVLIKPDRRLVIPRVTASLSSSNTNQRLEAIKSAQERFEVKRPSWYRVMFQRALMAFGLRRALGGGFGAWIPDSSSGG